MRWNVGCGGRSTDKLPVSILTAPFDAVEPDRYSAGSDRLCFNPHRTFRCGGTLYRTGSGRYVLGFNPHRTFRCGGTYVRG